MSTCFVRICAPTVVCCLVTGILLMACKRPPSQQQTQQAKRAAVYVVDKAVGAVVGAAAVESARKAWAQAEGGPIPESQLPNRPPASAGSLPTPNLVPFITLADKLEPFGARYSEFVVTVEARIFLSFNSPYYSQAGIFGESGVSSFLRGEAFAAYCSFHLRNGIESSVLSPGTYYFAVRSLVPGFNDYRATLSYVEH